MVLVASTRLLKASREPSRACSSRIRSRRWIGSSTASDGRASSTTGATLLVAVARRGESSIGSVGGRRASRHAVLGMAPVTRVRAVAVPAPLRSAPRAEVAEWQTRRSQTPLRATSCGFESHLRYQPSQRTRFQSHAGPAIGVDSARTMRLERGSGVEVRLPPLDLAVLDVKGVDPPRLPRSAGRPRSPSKSAADEYLPAVDRYRCGLELEDFLGLLVKVQKSADRVPTVPRTADGSAPAAG